MGCPIYGVVGVIRAHRTWGEVVWLDFFIYPDSVYRARGDEWPGYLVTGPMPSLSVNLTEPGQRGASGDRAAESARVSG